VRVDPLPHHLRPDTCGAAPKCFEVDSLACAVRAWRVARVGVCCTQTHADAGYDLTPPVLVAPFPGEPEADTAEGQRRAVLHGRAVLLLPTHIPCDAYPG